MGLKIKGVSKFAGFRRDLLVCGVNIFPGGSLDSEEGKTIF